MQDNPSLLAKIAQLEQQLAALQPGAAEAAPRAGREQRRDEFLALLAHELRNPLAPISMASNMLGKLPGASPELRKLHAIIERQVAHLSRVLDELLDSARLHGGQISLLRKPLGLVELIGRSAEAVQVRLLDRRQQLAMDMPAEMVVDGDPARLVQVFSSLVLGMSSLAGEGATIRIAARAGSRSALVTISADGSAGSPADGLGVARTIVQLHGGTLATGEGAGRGATSVTLPLYRGTDPAATGAAPAAPSARRILLIEDNRDANDTLRMLLAAEGHQVASAFDGIAGLGMARNREFDVLICDIGLPGMSGLELIGQLRRAPGSHIPFAIAISGYGQAADRERAIGAGFGHYFVKPVAVAALLALVASDAVSRAIAVSQRR